MYIIGSNILRYCKTLALEPLDNKYIVTRMPKGKQRERMTDEDYRREQANQDAIAAVNPEKIEQWGLFHVSILLWCESLWRYALLR